MPDPLRIDVWSDVVCPWCYIGKRRLEAAIDAFRRDPDAPTVEIVFHSFELMPHTPVDVDASAAAFLAQAKGLPEDDVRRMQSQVAGIAATVGLAYDLDALRPANTRRAHQLLHLARRHGLQVETKERLMRAHFVEGRHVGRIDELVDLAAEVGLDPAAVREALETDAHLADVAADVRRAPELGIRGVPFFVLDGRYGISGAQPAEVLTRALEQVAAERRDDPAA